MNDDERKELYKQHLEQAWDSLNASSDEHDKSIQTLSVAALGASLAFMKNIISLKEASDLWMLLASWICFGAAMLSVVLSHRFSVAAQRLHIEHLSKYYLEKKDEFLNQPNIWNKFVNILNHISAPLLALGIIFTIWFAWENVAKGNNLMADQKKNAPAITGTRTADGRTTAGMTKLSEGRIVQQMTPVIQPQGGTAQPDLEKGRGVLPMTPANPPQPSAPVPPPIPDPKKK